MPSSVVRTRRIFLIDDHPVLGKGLAALFNSEDDLQFCGECPSPDLLEASIREASPDILLLDVTIGETNGLDLLPRLQKSFPDLPVIIFSVHDELFYAPRALQGGARGYVMKAEDPEVLIEAIRQVAEGEIYASQRARRQLEKASELADSAAPFPVEEILTAREVEIVEAIAAGNDSPSIAEQLHLSVKTVEAHRSRIRKKLGLTSSIELIRFAVRWTQEHAGRRNRLAAGSRN